MDVTTVSHHNQALNYRLSNNMYLICRYFISYFHCFVSCCHQTECWIFSFSQGHHPGIYILHYNLYQSCIFFSSLYIHISSQDKYLLPMSLERYNFTHLERCYYWLHEIEKCRVQILTKCRRIRLLLTAYKFEGGGVGGGCCAQTGSIVTSSGDCFLVRKGNNLRKKN